MARRFKLWKAFLLAFIGSLVSLFLGLFFPGRNSEGQEIKSHPPGQAGLLPDDHWLTLPLPGDSDQDLLLDQEETALGLDSLDPDQNRSGVIDGPEVAEMFGKVIEGLPWWHPGPPDPTEIVKTKYPVYGTEICEVCGAEVNMGFLRITNPYIGMEVDIPFIGVHYLNHGSFSFEGTVHEGRIDPVALSQVLDDKHRCIVPNDTDKDFLSDGEETGIGKDPYHPDENGNFTADGIDLASELRAKIEALPYGPLPDQVYKVDHQAWGDEHCQVCGISVNMGFLEVTDPVKGLSAAVPYVALHAMDHGSFDFLGTANQGRVEVIELYEILQDVR